MEAGAVDPSYVDAMLERENSVSTFVGEGVAIPHGTLAGKDAVRTRLLEYFEIGGAEDPRVIAARRRLANLLY